MSTSNSVDFVHAFWDQVWNAHDAAAVDRFAVDDFIALRFFRRDRRFGVGFSHFSASV
jgi:hypothetical protein